MKNTRTYATQPLWGLLFLIAIITTPASATLIFYENFDLPAGELTASPNWTAVSQAGNGPIQVLDTPSDNGKSLSFTGLNPSIGGRIEIRESQEEDVGRTIAPAITTGTAYYSLLMKVTAPPSGVTYNAHFRGSGFNSRLFIEDLDGTDYQIGVSNSAGSPAFVSGSLVYNISYFIVVKYTFNPGPDDDTVGIFVNPTPGIPEPSSADASKTGNDITSIDEIVFRQNNGIGTIEFDELRVGTTWASVTPGNPPRALWTSGEVIPVAGLNAVGPLGGKKGFFSTPTGVADVFDNGPRDLFVNARALFPWIGFNSDESPVFGAPVTVTSTYNNGAILQTSSGEIHGVFHMGKKVIVQDFSKRDLSFSFRAEEILSIPEDIDSLGTFLADDGKLHVFFSISDGLPYHNQDVHPFDPSYRPFDGAGIWRGNLHYDYLWRAEFSSINLGKPIAMEQVSPTTKEFLFDNGNLTIVNFGPGHKRGLIGSAKLGGFHYFHNKSKTGVSLEEGVLVQGEDGIVLRHPVVNPSPIAFSNPITGLSDMVVGDSGGVWYYQFTGNFAPNGAPIFSKPKPVLRQQAHVTMGALPVLSPGDLNKDGLIDLVAGNDSGRLMFLENVGTPTAPAFAVPVPLNVGGKPLHVQAGYRGSIQGPGEARWGYTCPTVYDWNGDGYLDIVMSSILGDYWVVFQKPGSNPPSFDRPQPLYCDGLDLHLTWRQQPAVTDWGTTGQVCLVTFDEDDLLRCFWKLDDHNVTRGELLRLDDGRVIEANVHGAGQRGRTKLQAVDWDGDGRIDLLAGSRRWHSIPSPANGLPQSLGSHREAAVLFLRNVGTNANPVFAFPEFIKFKGDRIALGIHSCSPVAADLGSGVLDLIVGEERGSLIYYSRADLTPR